MANTNRLTLPYLAAAQAQKHVTHNDALRILDGVVQLRVKNATLSAPPGSPAEGDLHIVSGTGTGDWTGWDGDVAMRADGTWYRIPAIPGMRAWDAETNTLLVNIGAGWTDLAVAMGLVKIAADIDLAVSANGGTTGIGILEEHLTGLSGATRTSTIQIPDRSICLGVSTRTTAGIGGATSYDCGIAGEVAKFGGSLGAALGSTNIGVIVPEAFYADTPIVLTANGSNFTGGSVRLAIHYLTLGVPS